MRQPVPVSIGEPAAAESATRDRFRAIGRWISKVEYDPDKGTRADDFNASAPEYAKRFGIASEAQARFKVQVPGYGDAFIPVEMQGVLLEPVAESKRWKPVKINDRAELEQFFESDRGRHKRFIEQFGIGPAFDADFDRQQGQSATSLID